MSFASTFKPTREITVLIACMAATLIGELTLLFRMDLAEIVHHVPDDSFFYLIIGERLRESGRFSFDGEHLTSGFQPLYQWIIAAMAYVIRDPLVLLYSTLVLGSVLHVACAASLFQLVRRLFGRFGAWTAAVFWLGNPALVAWFWSVKENGLYTLILLWAFRLLQRIMESDEPSRLSRRLGLALGLAVLARVNFVLLWAAVAPLMLLGIGWQPPARRRARQLLTSAGWACLVAAPWFVFAKLRFGSMFPISGTVKLNAGKEYVAHELGVGWMSLRHLLGSARTAYDYLDRTFKAGAGIYGPFVQGGVIAVLAGWAWSRARGRVVLPAMGVRPFSLYGAVAVCAAFNAFLNALLLPQFLLYGQWYTAPEFVALGIGVGWIGAMARRHLASAAGAVFLALGMTLGFLVWSEIRRVPWEWRGPTLHVLEGRPYASTILLEMGLWTRDHVPEGERVGIYDPGIVTFFSDRKLVSLDPLVNSREFFLEERRDILDYVRRNRLSYVWGAGVRRDGRFQSLLLPPGSYDVVWLPYPDVDLRWLGKEPCYWMLVRPHDTPGHAFLRVEDFGFGRYAPEAVGPDPLAPARSRSVARALEGFSVECDVLRLQLPPLPRTRARLWLDGEVAREDAPGPEGWVDWDLSRHRGRRARVEVTGGAAPVDAHFVDLRFDRSDRR